MDPDLHSAFGELRDILGADELEADDELFLRLAELEIEIGALDTTRERKNEDSPDWCSVELKRIELGQRLAELALNVLGYYALPDPAPGDNEPVPGSVYAPKLRSHYLKAMQTDEIRVMEMRDALADFLASRVDEGTR